jgi:phospholipase C
MDYPIKVSGSLPISQSLSTAFRPAKAGLVKVIAVIAWDASVPPPPPPTFLDVQLEIFKPGNALPVATTSDRKQVGISPDKNLGAPRFVIWADALATAADLGADWSAKITNRGDVPASYAVTVRYQVVDGNLGKIDHIVVMMLENRSFDHMLGYLTLEKGRTDINGLTGNETNLDDNENVIKVHHRTDTYFRNDPGHGYTDVADQLTWPALTPDSSNTGFVHNFAKILAANAPNLPPIMAIVQDKGLIAGGDSRTISFRPGQPGPITIVTEIDKNITHSESGKLGALSLHRPGNPILVIKTIPIGGRSLSLAYTATAADLSTPGNWTCSVINATETSATFQTRINYVQIQHDLNQQESADAIMGYYNADELPAYDVLANEFAVCDRWFASLPTDTFPNRRYGLTGGSGGMDTTPSAADVTKSPLVFAYTEKTIFEVLQDHKLDWKIFFSDLPFAFVFKAFAQDARLTQRMRTLSNGDGGDLEHAVTTGDLPCVSWIDPNFSDFRESVAAASDDHPPGGVTNGQRLVRQIYNYLSASPAWTKTLLLICYDEHGGFYDHVRPPGLSTDENNPAPGGPPDHIPKFRRYGVRVPAFVVSPWAKARSVSSDTYDNTTLLKTILNRFCPDSANSMGERVAGALDVSSVLSLGTPRGDIPQIPEIPDPPPEAAIHNREPDSFGDVLRKSIFGF